MSSPPTARRIVLVDDEEALAWSLTGRLAKLRPQDVIESAYDGETALARIEQGPVDLLIADIRMPGMSGIDLVLAARRLYPELPVIVMTAFKSADIARIDVGPFTGFLEKPFEFERLRDLVEEAFAPQVVGFSGAISVQTLPDIVQLYALSSATGLLTVSHRSGTGRLYFSSGAVLHAVVELRSSAVADHSSAPGAQTTSGDDAFYEIMSWSGGEFSMRTGVMPTERSIENSWHELLMESVRRSDEQRRCEEPRPSRQGWTQAPPPPPPSDDILFDEAFLDFGDGALTPAPSRDLITSTPEGTTETHMNIKDSLAKLNSIDGFVGAALVDSESGMLLGQEGGGGMNLEIAAAGNTEVVRAKRKTMNNLALKDGIEDMLISLSKQYHLIRPLRTRSTLFFYLVLDRQRANLAMSRIALADVEKELQV